MNRNLIRVGALLCAVMLLFGGCLRRGEKGKGTGDRPAGMTAEEIMALKNPEQSTLVADGVTYRRRKNVSTLLLMGIDKGGTLDTAETDKGGQCDVLLLIVLDRDAGLQTILQIDRDTMTDVEMLDYRGKSTGLTRTQQICLSHSYGQGDEKSCENVVRTVSRLLMDIPVDGYASILYDAIPELNDAVGGIEVTIEDDFSAADPSFVMGKTVILKGKQALTYVRGRQTVADGTNVNRMKRQRTFLNRFGDRVRGLLRTDSSVINDLYAVAEPYMLSDLTLSELTSFALEGAGYKDGGILTTSGEHVTVKNPNGTSSTEFYPEEESILQTVLTLFYEPVG